MDRLLSVVVSVYNEEKALEDFYKETTGILKDVDWAYELILPFLSACLLLTVRSKLSAFPGILAMRLP